MAGGLTDFCNAEIRYGGESGHERSTLAIDSRIVGAGVAKFYSISDEG
jgi:hypothetical protein